MTSSPVFYKSDLTLPAATCSGQVIHCSVLLELGESLVHLLAVKSGKGGHFSGRHRLACATHSIENLCCCFYTD